MSAAENAEGVRHNPAECRFEFAVAGSVALLEYELEPGRVTLTHTFVPPALRGRGLAEQVVRAALDWARAENLRVIPACSYVARFVARHTEYRPLVD